MDRKFISLSVVVIAVMSLAVGTAETEAFGPHRNYGSQQNGFSGVQQPACNVVPYTAYVAQPVGCLPPLGGFHCYYQNTGYQSRAYKGCITKLP